MAGARPPPPKSTTANFRPHGPWRTLDMNSPASAQSFRPTSTARGPDGGPNADNTEARETGHIDRGHTSD
eukprot:11155056-Lingulodinium_polyedra.AAC.1